MQRPEFRSPRIHIKSWVCWYMPVNPSLGEEGETTGLFSKNCPASLSRYIMPGINEKTLVSKKENNKKIDLWPPLAHVHMHPHTQRGTHMNNYTYKYTLPWPLHVLFLLNHCNNSLKFYQIKIVDCAYILGHLFSDTGFDDSWTFSQAVVRYWVCYCAVVVVIVLLLLSSVPTVVWMLGRSTVRHSINLKLQKPHLYRDTHTNIKQAGKQNASQAASWASYCWKIMGSYIIWWHPGRAERILLASEMIPMLPSGLLLTRN